jgi:hypothetical protein
MDNKFKRPPYPSDSKFASKKSASGGTPPSRLGDFTSPKPDSLPSQRPNQNPQEAKETQWEIMSANEAFVKCGFGYGVKTQEWYLLLREAEDLGLARFLGREDMGGFGGRPDPLMYSFSPQFFVEVDKMMGRDIKVEKSPVYSRISHGVSKGDRRAEKGQQNRSEERWQTMSIADAVRKSGFGDIASMTANPDFFLVFQRGLRLDLVRGSGERNQMGFEIYEFSPEFFKNIDTLLGEGEAEKEKVWPQRQSYGECSQGESRPGWY